MDDNKRIVEIDGVKIEVDLRTAKKVDHFRVGDNVKILDKKYSGEYRVRPAIIVDFAEFSELPTIVLAVLEENYSGTPDIKFVHYNANSEDKLEIVPASEDEIKVTREGVCKIFEDKIADKEHDLNDLKNKYEFFKERFLKPIIVEGKNNEM